jgi:hypothetical protein
MTTQQSNQCHEYSQKFKKTFFQLKFEIFTNVEIKRIKYLFSFCIEKKSGNNLRSVGF